MAHNASKAAVRLMTKSVAVQHAKDNIRANSVHPGVMPPMRTSGRTADPAVRAEHMRVIPMRRREKLTGLRHSVPRFRWIVLHHRFGNPTGRRSHRHIGLRRRALSRDEICGRGTALAEKDRCARRLRAHGTTCRSGI